MLSALMSIPGASSAVFGLVLLALGSAIGAYGGYRFEAGRYEALVARYATAQAQATKAAADEQHRLDQDALTATSQYAQQQAAIAARLQKERDRAQAYVAGNGCVTWGFVRLLDAAVLGVVPESLSLPAGAVDAACSTVTPAALARAILANYAIAQSDAGQLDALIRLLKKEQG